MGLALGYEDLNDHDVLRHDPLLALLSEVTDPRGQGRRRGQDKGSALAGKSTLNRLELTPKDADAVSRYKKIVAEHGHQEGRFFHGYYRSYCYLPQYIFFLLCPCLRIWFVTPFA